MITAIEPCATLLYSPHVTLAELAVWPCWKPPLVLLGRDTGRIANAPYAKSISRIV